MPALSSRTARPVILRRTECDRVLFNRIIVCQFDQYFTSMRVQCIWKNVSTMKRTTATFSISLLPAECYLVALSAKSERPRN